MLENDVDLYLPGGCDEHALRTPDYGGGYCVTGVRFVDGRFRLQLLYCGDDDKKRLRTASVSLTPSVIGKMMEALSTVLWRAQPQQQISGRASVQVASGNCRRRRSPA
jgi:hypothetical protein